MTWEAVSKALKEKILKSRLTLRGEVMHFPLSPCGQFASTRGLLRLLCSHCYMQYEIKISIARTALGYASTMAHKTQEFDH